MSVFSLLLFVKSAHQLTVLPSLFLFLRHSEIEFESTLLVIYPPRMQVDLCMLDLSVDPSDRSVGLSDRSVGLSRSVDLDFVIAGDLPGQL